MVIERFNSEQPDHGWKPPHDQAVTFEAPTKPASTEAAGKALAKPEGKKERKKRKKGQESDNPLFAAAPRAEGAETKRTAEKIPPLLGEGIIWQSESPIKSGKSEKPEKTTEKTDESIAEESTRTPEERSEDKPSTSETPAETKPSEEPVTAEQAYMLQQRLHGTEASKSDDRDDAEPTPRYQPLPQIQHQARDEQGPGDEDDRPETHDMPQPPAGPEERPTQHDAGYEDVPHAEQYVPYTAGHEAAPDDPPPALPPDPTLFAQAQRHWERMTSHTESSDRADREAIVEPVITSKPAGRYESDTPPGMQRSTADVSRAAWTGMLAGWWLGRRGKRKAVEQARRTGRQEGLAEAGRKLEAEPLHNYPSVETNRTTIMPISVETHAPEAKKHNTAEKAAATVASVAALERLRPSIRPSAEVPRPARAAAAKAAERVIAKPERPREAPMAVPEVRADEKLSKREVMSIAKDIKIDGVSLKEVYNAKRIDEEGVRAVVATYLRGGSVREKLSKEIIAKEMSFERDPMFRHNRRSGEVMERVGRALNKGVDVARDLAGERGAQLAASTQQAAHKAGHVMASGAKQAQHDLVDNGNSADWFGITAIVVVWSIILILLIT